MDRRGWLGIGAGIGVLIVAGALVWFYLRPFPEPPPPEEPLPGEKVVLYFLNIREYRLQKVPRNVPEAKNISQRVNQIVEQLKIEPDTEPLTVMLPRDLKLRSVFVGDQMIYLDFNDALIGAAQGSSGEMMFLYSIVNSVLANLPDRFKLVRFLVEGEKRKTIGPYGEESGHIAIQYPLGPRWELAEPTS